MAPIAASRQVSGEVFFADADAAVARQLHRRAKAGELLRIAPGIYTLAGPEDEVRARVRRHWQPLAGHLVPQGVVSHLSAFTRGLTEDGYVTLSHPTRYNRTIRLPGVDLVLLPGPGPQPGDTPRGGAGHRAAKRYRAGPAQRLA